MQRKSKWNLQEIVNAIFYLTKNGCMWRDLPGEFPSWQTVYWYYVKWVNDSLTMPKIYILYTLSYLFTINNKHSLLKLKKKVSQKYFYLLEN
jgi:hypothetical protein